VNRGSRAKSSIVSSRLSGAVLCERCVVADRPLARLRGLLGRKRLEPDEGLLVRPAGAVHTCFMRFAIDAVFLDSELRVVGVVPDLPPWRAAARRRARAVLELPAGECRRRGIEVGDELELAQAPAGWRRAFECEGFVRFEARVEGLSRRTENAPACRQSKSNEPS
jgi:uncharacterized protein